MFGQQMSPMAQRMMTLMQRQQPKDGMAYPPGMQEGYGYDDENPYLQDESMMGIPDDGNSEQGEPIYEEEAMGMGYGPIGNRMERMQPQLVHDRPELQRRYPRGIPPDVDETTRMMEGTDDSLRGAELHDRQHRQMKQHARSSKFGLRRSLSEMKALKRAEDKAAISGPGADTQYDEVELLRQELNDLKRSMGKK